MKKETNETNEIKEKWWKFKKKLNLEFWRSEKASFILSLLVEKLSHK